MKSVSWGRRGLCCGCPASTLLPHQHSCTQTPMCTPSNQAELLPSFWPAPQSTLWHRWHKCTYDSHATHLEKKTIYLEFQLSGSFLRSLLRQGAELGCAASEAQGSIPRVFLLGVAPHKGKGTMLPQGSGAGTVRCNRECAAILSYSEVWQFIHAFAAKGFTGMKLSPHGSPVLALLALFKMHPMGNWIARLNALRFLCFSQI